MDGTIEKEHNGISRLNLLSSFVVIVMFPWLTANHTSLLLFNKYTLLTYSGFLEETVWHTSKIYGYGITSLYNGEEFQEKLFWNPLRKCKLLQKYG